MSFTKIGNDIAILRPLSDREDNTFLLSYAEFRETLLVKCLESESNGFDFSEALDDPGLIRYRDSYCVYHFDKTLGRLKMGFGKKGDLSSPFDFAVVPIFVGAADYRTHVEWARPYRQDERFQTEMLAQLCLEILCQKL